MNPEQLTFFGGLETTGDVQFLYGRGSKALLFDFGIQHKGLVDASYIFTHDAVCPTLGRDVRQYMLGRMAPPILELYDAEQVDTLSRDDIRKAWNGINVPNYEEIRIFIGHMHQDHMALLPYAHEGITIYMNRDSYTLYRGIVASGEYADTKANIVPLEDLSIIDFGPFTMQIIEMDHKSLGASGFIIESSDYTTAYTGDWRRHGRHPERIDHFIEMCRRKDKIDILITESTKVQSIHQGMTRASRHESDVIAEYTEC